MSDKSPILPSVGANTQQPPSFSIPETQKKPKLRKSNAIIQDEQALQSIPVPSARESTPVPVVSQSVLVGQQNLLAHQPLVSPTVPTKRPAPPSRPAPKRPIVASPQPLVVQQAATVAEKAKAQSQSGGSINSTPSAPLAHQQAVHNEQRKAKSLTSNAFLQLSDKEKDFINRTVQEFYKNENVTDKKFITYDQTAHSLTFKGPNPVGALQQVIAAASKSPEQQALQEKLVNATFKLKFGDSYAGNLKEAETKANAILAKAANGIPKITVVSIAGNDYPVSGGKVVMTPKEEHKPSGMSNK